LELEAPPPLEALLAQARARNFNLRARMLDVEQQGFSVRLAENERWPTFKVAPYVSQQRADAKETQFGIGVSLPLPLFDRNKGKIMAARAREAQAAWMLEAQVRELERQVAAQRSACVSFMEELAKWPPDALSSVLSAAEEADEHYRLGALPLSTFIELQKQSVEALNSVLESQLGALNARSNLEQLTGALSSK
jgi:cobalt-zinc-cadmium efflux system outer membrane protein